jgi:protein-tyrosine phosphatase
MKPFFSTATFNDRSAVTMEDTTQQQSKEEAPPWAWIKAVNDILTEGPWEEPSLPLQVLPWLMLSGLMDLSNTKRLLELGVTHVLTTNKFFSCNELQNLKNRLNNVGIDHFAVPGEDEPGYDMLQHWDTCRAYLQKIRKDTNSKVVVHCAAGQNRSGLITAAALLALERMELLDAVKLLKAKRGIVLTNLSFQKQLCLLAAKEGLLGEKPKGYTDDPVPDGNYTPWPIETLFGDSNDRW